MQIGAATVENDAEVPQKIKNETALGPNDSTAENISKQTQTTNLKDYLHPYVYCNIIYNSEELESTQVRIGGWVDKKSYGTFTQWKVGQKKKNEIFTFCVSLDRPTC